MTEPKACPLCGNQPEKIGEWFKCCCLNGYFTIESWNTRPIEDRLRAALERIEHETSMGTHMSPPIRDMAREALK